MKKLLRRLERFKNDDSPRTNPPPPKAVKPAELNDEAELEQYLAAGRPKEVQILILSAHHAGRKCLGMRFAMNIFTDEPDPLEDYQYRKLVTVQGQPVIVDFNACVWLGCLEGGWMTLLKHFAAAKPDPSFMLVYHVGKPDSFAQLKAVPIESLPKGGGYVVATAIDLPAAEQLVSDQEGMALAQEIGVGFLRVSAVTGKGCGPEDLDAIVTDLLFARLANDAKASTG